MRVYKSRWFERFARKEGIADSVLWDAVIRAELGQIDAELGGDVIKQRIAREGQGRSKGYRTIILFRRGVKAFFVFGFAKSQMANVDQQRSPAVQRGRETRSGVDREATGGAYETRRFCGGESE